MNQKKMICKYPFETNLSLAALLTSTEEAEDAISFAKLWKNNILNEYKSIEAFSYDNY
jgi:hypothetical protein